MASGAAVILWGAGLALGLIGGEQRRRPGQRAAENDPGHGTGANRQGQTITRTGRSRSIRAGTGGRSATEHGPCARNVARTGSFAGLGNGHSGPGLAAAHSAL